MKTDLKEFINKQGSIVFEIGAADGLDTNWLLSVMEHSDSRMYCFEPNPKCIEIFRNTVKDTRATLFEMAIGDIDGKGTFNLSSTPYSSSLRKPTEYLFKTWPNIEFIECIEIDVITLDLFVEKNNIEMIDFIWADVQGAEDIMIYGGVKTFENKVKYLYTEYSNIPYYENEPTLADILNQLGESWEIIEDCKTDVLLRNKKIK